MGDAKTFQCSNCGAPLMPSGADKVVRCPYCRTAVIVPKELRDIPAPANAMQFDKAQNPGKATQGSEGFKDGNPSYGSAAADRRARKEAARRAKIRQAAQVRLKKLKEQHAANLISQADYEMQKAEILKDL